MSLALLFALALSGQPATPPAAPPAPVDSVSPVIVTAHKPPVLTQQATRDFVYGVSTASRGHDQLARFDDPICVKVEGLDPPYDEVVADDIRRIAREVGAKVDAPVCAPNLLILFTTDVDRLMANLYVKRWEVLEGENPNEPAVKRFSQERRPIAWWRVTQVGGYAGTPPTNVGDKNAAPIYEWARASHIQSNIIEHLVRLVVVVDGKKVEGLSLGQIGDYIAFAALADANPERKPGAGSIMSLFDSTPDPAAPKLRITTWDKAFLTAFYRSFSDRASNLQEEQVAGEMRRILAKPETKPSRKPAG